MPREASLYEEANGSIVEAYFLLKEGSANIPPMWIERARESRKKLHKDVATILRKENLLGIQQLRDFELRFRKENFYQGLRILLELERQGKTKL
jgi:hypothetical protein